MAAGRAAITAAVARETYEPPPSGAWDETLERMRDLARPPIV